MIACEAVGVAYANSQLTMVIIVVLNAAKKKSRIEIQCACYLIRQ